MVAGLGQGGQDQWPGMDRGGGVDSRTGDGERWAGGGGRRCGTAGWTRLRVGLLRAGALLGRAPAGWGRRREDAAEVVGGGGAEGAHALPRVSAAEG